MPISEDLSTELKAVNIILAGQGEQPVESLDAIESSLAQAAQNALYEASRTVQAKGWFWNREEDYLIARNDVLEMLLPANTLEVTSVRDSRVKCVQRGEKLYNRTDHTYKFVADAQVRVDLTVYLTWEEIPEFARQAIIYIAQRRFQMRELTSTAIDQAIRDDLDACYATLREKEDDQGPSNILADGNGMGLWGNGARRR